MTYLDIGVLVLLVLGALFGVLKGVKKRVARFVAIAAGLAVGILFYAMLGNVILNSTSFGQTLAEFFGNKILDGAGDGAIHDLLSQPYQNFVSSDSAIKEIFSQVKIPDFFISFFATKVYITDGSAALAIGSAFASSIVYAVCFILLFVLTAVVVGLLVRFIIGDKVGIIDRLFGLVWYTFAMGVFILIVMMVLIGVSYVSPELESWLNVQAHVGQDYVSIGSLFYNWAWQIINAFKMLF